MADSFWLSDAQMARIGPFFSRSHGIARVDDRRVLSGIIHVIRTGNAGAMLASYGSHKTHEAIVERDRVQLGVQAALRAADKAG